MSTIAEMAREERVENITAAIVEAAIAEAIRNEVGCAYILEALIRAEMEIISIKTQRTSGGIERMNDLRRALGMTTTPTAAGTAK